MYLDPVYDVGVGRSILHYFDEDMQPTVLKNIYNSLKPGGYYLSQNFVQLDSDIELYLELNKAIEKSFVLMSKDRLMKMFKESGFSEVRFLRALPVWNYSSENLQKRYSLSSEDIEAFRQTILNTPGSRRVGFKITDRGFTIPIPYQVFLMRK